MLSFLHNRVRIGLIAFLYIIAPCVFGDYCMKFDLLEKMKSKIELLLKRQRKAPVLNSVEKPPSLDMLEQELRREKYKITYLSVLRSTVYTLVTVAAVAVLVAVLLLPVLQIYGTSMSPTLCEGEIVLSVKGSKFDAGDVVAFYYNNKILVKRVICDSGEWFDMDDDGTVYVNGSELDEPYITDKAYGECDIELPYQVPESRIFVLGDHRSVSVDSRSTTVGCVAEEQIVGKIVFRVWPLTQFGPVH